ncbi:MAG: maltose alpha-D-glucosyltransferase, partial [Verrucomicrobiota bacterium]|nr:maltose alpha-D-glucosyltransferase [Verrucomicrobiota bacterium]
QRARRAPAGSEERDFYVWSDTPQRYGEARIIFKDFESSNWTWDPVAKAYFWHRFYSHQPDLNFDNPRVHDALLRAIDFWLEMGVDGVRLDAVPYLYEREGTNCENLPETHEFLRKLRRHIDAKFGDRMLLAEANQWPEDSAAYFGQGDECHMEFHFPLMPRMFMALQMEDRFPIIDILEQTPAIPSTCQWAIFLRNHDELTLEMVTDEERDYMYRVYAQDVRARINLGIRRRLAPLLANSRRRIELINSLLFSFPGTPIIYYGDEIGMGDNFYLGDRNGVRTPMQWTPDRNAGFSKANPQQLYLPTILDPEYHYESVNVENQQRNLTSLFWWMRRMLAVRRGWSAFAHGSVEFLHPENAKVLAYLRRHGEETILAVANLSRFAQVVELDLSAFAGFVPEELFGHTLFPVIRQTPAVFTLGPHGFYWFALRPFHTLRSGLKAWIVPALELEPDWSPGFLQILETKVLPDYIDTCRWFGGKGRTLRELRVIRNIPIGRGPSSAQLLFLETAFAEGLPDIYVLPLQVAEGDPAQRVLREAPHSVLARMNGDRLLCDAFYLSEFRAQLLRSIAENSSWGTPRSRLAGSHGPEFPAGEIEPLATASRVGNAEQSNSSAAFGELWFLKFFRRFERGPHPDVEVIRCLGELGFPHVPKYAGELRLTDTEGDGVIALLVSFTQNQGDGWSYTLDALARFFERVLAA